MNKNKIYRRQGIFKNVSYNYLADDFEELFSGFSNVTVERVTSESEVSENKLIVNFDADKKMRLVVSNDSEKGFIVKLYCNTGNTESRDYIYLESSNKGEKITYSFAKTDYGVAFSSFPNTSDANFTVQDSCIQSFFSVFEDEEGKKVNCFIYVSNDDDNMNDNPIYFISPYHTQFETPPTNKGMAGKAANQTVLCNAVSYNEQLVAPHLYKKYQTESNKFGKMKIGGRTFIVGSHYCLECGED